MKIDIPSEDILKELEPALKLQIKEATQTLGGEAIIQKVEWTAEGISVWILTGKLDIG